MTWKVQKKKKQQKSSICCVYTWEKHGSITYHDAIGVVRPFFFFFLFNVQSPSPTPKKKNLFSKHHPTFLFSIFPPKEQHISHTYVITHHFLTHSHVFALYKHVISCVASYIDFFTGNFVTPYPPKHPRHPHIFSKSQYIYFFSKCIHFFLFFIIFHNGNCNCI